VATCHQWRHAGVRAGRLYIGTGDGGSGNDPPNNAPNMNVLLGKILRIDVDHPDTVARIMYSSPADNPFAHVAGRDEIFAYGCGTRGASALIARPSETFSWTANSVAATEWWLNAGSTVGSTSYFNSGSSGKRLSTTVTGLQSNGSAVFVRLWYKIGGIWKSVDFQYAATTSWKQRRWLNDESSIRARAAAA
jgi:hypothetical protein